MISEESSICDGIFGGSAIIRLVRKNIVVESGIRDGFFLTCVISCAFFVKVRVRVRVCWCAYVQHIWLEFRLWLGFVEALIFDSCY